MYEGTQAGKRAEQSVGMGVGEWRMRTVPGMADLCGKSGPSLWLNKAGLVPKVAPVRQVRSLNKWPFQRTNGPG